MVKQYSVYVPVRTYVHEDNLRELLQRYYNTTGSIRKAVHLLATIDNYYISRRSAEKYLQSISPEKVEYISLANIRDVMKYTGLKQKEIAYLLNLSQPTISRKLQKNEFNSEELDILRKYLCKDIE